MKRLTFGGWWYEGVKNIEIQPEKITTTALLEWQMSFTDEIQQLLSCSLDWSTLQRAMAG